MTFLELFNLLLSSYRKFSFSYGRISLRKCALTMYSAVAVECFSVTLFF